MRILIIDGHPYQNSFCSAIADKYHEGALESGHDSTLFRLSEKQFDPILRSGYKKPQSLEPDLELAQQLIQDARHLVVVTPIWWGGPPGLLKGFMDRTFLPGFAFKYRSKSKLWDKFLTGRSGRLIVTSDAPTWWMRFIRGDSTVKMIRDSTLGFVGIAPVRVTRLGDIKWLTPSQREAILERIFQLGKQGK